MWLHCGSHVRLCCCHSQHHASDTQTQEEFYSCVKGLLTSSRAVYGILSRLRKNCVLTPIRIPAGQQETTRGLSAEVAHEAVLLLWAGVQSCCCHPKWLRSSRLPGWTARLAYRADSTARQHQKPCLWLLLVLLLQ